MILNDFLLICMCIANDCYVLNTTTYDKYVQYQLDSIHRYVCYNMHMYANYSFILQ